jgi:hypothetical protein
MADGTALLARRLQRNKAKVAVARELCGFIWALLRNLDCYRQETPTTAPKMNTRVGCAA